VRLLNRLIQWEWWIRARAQKRRAWLIAYVIGAFFLITAGSWIFAIGTVIQNVREDW